MMKTKLSRRTVQQPVPGDLRGTQELLDILSSHGIDPYEDPDMEFPEIGSLEDDETVYRTSLDEVNRDVPTPHTRR